MGHMHYVIQIELDKMLYIGYTTDLKNRIRPHNDGKVVSAKFSKNGTVQAMKSVHSSDTVRKSHNRSS